MTAKTKSATAMSVPSIAAPTARTDCSTTAAVEDRLDALHERPGQGREQADQQEGNEGEREAHAAAAALAVVGAEEAGDQEGGGEAQEEGRCETPLATPLRDGTG